MTVFKIGNGKLKVILSDREVLSYFGEYDKIFAMNCGTRLTVKRILKEELAEYHRDFSKRIIIEMRPRTGAGCVIIISDAYKTAQRNNTEEALTVFEFSDFYTAAAGICRLLSTEKDYRSRLYISDRKYRLIIKTEGYTDFFFMNEYCESMDSSPIAIAYTEEYFTPVIEENAVEIIGCAFSESRRHRR